LLRAFSNTRFASRNSTAIDIIRLVTGPVTVNGNKAREKTSVQDPVTLVASRQSLRVAQRLRALLLLLVRLTSPIFYLGLGAFVMIGDALVVGSALLLIETY